MSPELTEQGIHNLINISICIYHEARGESVEGQKAVAYVILNRMAKTDKTAEEVIYKKHQFTWTSYNPTIKDYKALADCVVNAMCAINEFSQYHSLEIKPPGDLENYMHADHYYNPKYADPLWAHSPTMVKLGQIGNHLFLQELRNGKKAV